MPGIGLIANPYAKRNRRDPSLRTELAGLLSADDLYAEPTDLAGLAQVAAACKQRGIGVLAIHGGDGTMHRAMTAIGRAWGADPLPPVALLPGGNSNIIAACIGMRSRAPAALRAILAAHRAGDALPVVRRWLTEVDGGTEDGGQRQYGFMFGTGIVSSFLELFYEGGNPTGPKAAYILLRGGLSAAIGGRYVQRLARPFHGEVAVDGVAWPGESWTAIASGTVEQIGLGFAPFYQCATHPGQLHAVGIGGTPLDLALELPGIRLSRPLRRPGNRGQVATELVLRSSAPIDHMIDGDFHRGGPEVVARVGAPVAFLLPPS